MIENVVYFGGSIVIFCTMWCLGRKVRFRRLCYYILSALLVFAAMYMGDIFHIMYNAIVVHSMLFVRIMLNQAITPKILSVLCAMPMYLFATVISCCSGFGIGSLTTLVDRFVSFLDSRVNA